MPFDDYQLSLISIKKVRLIFIRLNFDKIKWILVSFSILTKAQKFSTRIRYSYFFCRYIYERKCMTTTEREWCEKVVYWKMMCFDHSFHLSLLNDQIIFWFDGKRWAEKPHHSRPALNIDAWHVKMLVSEMICRCRPLFHHLQSFSIFEKPFLNHH